MASNNDFRDAAGRFASANFEGEKLLDAIEASALRAAKKAAPRRSGQLADRLHAVRRTNERLITSEVPYLKYVIGGTRAHVIHAKNARALAFNIGGRTVFAKSVNHPGTRANDFLETALDDAGPEFQRALEKAGDDFLKWLAG